MEECVNVYEKQRGDLLNLARRIVKDARSKQTDGMTEERPSKRRRTQQVNGRDITAEMPMRATRSRSRMVSRASQETRKQSVVEDSEDDGSQYVEDSSSPSPGKPSSHPPDDGLVACPMCNKRMKEEAVFTHLDQCNGQDRSSTPQNAISTQKQSNSVAYSIPSPSKARQRLGALNYTLLTETALRKKLAEIGIPSHGPKPLMQRRHMEWMNLWNASCDSSRPQTKRELLRELDVWERTQGRQIANAQGPSGVMAKDFDADGWAKLNRDDFSDLIRKAKEKARKPESKDDGAAEKQSPIQSQDVVSTDHSSTSNGVVDLDSTAKPPLKQRQSQSSQMSGVIA